MLMKLRFSQVYAFLTALSLFYLAVTGYVQPRSDLVTALANLLAVG